MKQLLLLTACIIFFPTQHKAQGCAGVKNVAEVRQEQFLQGDLGSTSSRWIVGVNNRYFKSFRDFRAKVDLETLPENRSINRNFTSELSVNHLLNKGWSISLAVPMSANVREASREHGGPNTQRFKTRAFGLGDMRLVVSKWLLPTAAKQKGNIQLGLGLKFPTGDFAQQDYFHQEGGLVLAPVNPGIQPGDGGLGLIGEVSAYCDIAQKICLYTNLYYMASPLEHNGASWGDLPHTTKQIEAGIDLMSVPDAFALRGGIYHGLSSSLGVLIKWGWG